MRWAGYVAQEGEERQVKRVLVEKPEGKIPLGRPRRRWGMGSERILGRFAGVWSGFSWLIDRDRWRALVKTIMKLRVLVS
jgi:hypothetical protein